MVYPNSQMGLYRALHNEDVSKDVSKYESLKVNPYSLKSHCALRHSGPHLPRLLLAAPLLRIRDTSFATLGFSATFSALTGILHFNGYSLHLHSEASDAVCAVCCCWCVPLAVDLRLDMGLQARH